MPEELMVSASLSEMFVMGSPYPPAPRLARAVRTRCTAFTPGSQEVGRNNRSGVLVPLPSPPPRGPDRDRSPRRRSAAALARAPSRRGRGGVAGGDVPAVGGRRAGAPRTRGAGTALAVRGAGGRGGDGGVVGLVRHRAPAR